MQTKKTTLKYTFHQKTTKRSATIQLIQDALRKGSWEEKKNTTIDA